jgi:hypothetical protein
MAKDGQSTESASASARVKVCGMRTWQKTIARISLPVRWMGSGLILVLLSFIGLSALAPLNYEQTQPKFFSTLFLLIAFEIGFVTLTISFNCWFNLKLSRRKRTVRELSMVQSHSLLPWLGQKTASNEQCV